MKSDEIGVIPTDTLYGIVGSALNPKVVERIYKLRRRSPEKPMIILISSLEDLELFNIQLDPKTRKILEKVWPNSVSVILACPSGRRACPESKFRYLHRGTNTLAFRMPNDKKLLKFLGKTGPLVAPSANVEGEKPAETIEEAKAYFGDRVDFYQDVGKLTSQPSTLIEFRDNKVNILRQGAFQIDPNQLK